MSSIRVLIADAHAIFCRGLRHACEIEGGFEVLGEARDEQDFVDMACRLQPDIILLDIQLPLLNCAQAIRTITGQNPNVGVIMLFRKDACTFEEAIQAGARGYLLKDVDEQTLIKAIRAVHRGETVIDPYVTVRMFSALRDAQQAKDEMTERERPGRTEALSDKEIEILRLVAQGMNNHNIAKRLHVVEKTVVNYLSSVYRKLDVNNRTQAALYALRQGWTTLDAGR